MGRAFSPGDAWEPVFPGLQPGLVCFAPLALKSTGDWSAETGLDPFLAPQAKKRHSQQSSGLKARNMPPDGPAARPHTRSEAPTVHGLRPPERQRRVPYQPGLKGQGMGFKTGKRAEGPKHAGDVMQVVGSEDTPRHSGEVSGAPTRQTAEECRAGARRSQGRHLLAVVR